MAQQVTFNPGTRAEELAAQNAANDQATRAQQRRAEADRQPPPDTVSVRSSRPAAESSRPANSTRLERPAQAAMAPRAPSESQANSLAGETRDLLQEAQMKVLATANNTPQQILALLRG